MTKKIAALLFFTASVMGSAAFAGDATTEFSKTAKENMKVCKILHETSALLASVGGGYDDKPVASCISDFKAKTSPKFKAALAEHKKNKPAQGLLKDYYAAWMSAMDGIMPASDERKITYANRQAESERRLDEMWNRFEIEAGT